MLLLALLALLQSGPGDAARSEAQRLAALGQRLYEAGDAAGAAAAFDAAAATGWTAGALEYDWGTACLAAGDLGCAVLHLRRAERLMPGHAAVAHNLRVARARVGAEAPPRARPLLRAVQQGPGMSPLLALGLALYLAVLGLAGYRLWTRRSTPWLRRTLVVLVPVTAGVLGLAAWGWVEARAPEAVVVAPAALHGRPAGAAGRGLPAGIVVRLDQRRGDWVEVRLGGERGWVPARAVEEI